jgi:putative membrane protein
MELTHPLEPSKPFEAKTISRPHKSLFYYYLFVSMLTGVGFPFVFLVLFFKYETLRYKLDDEGVSMCWGLLFRREIYLTYRRIQDIHLTRNLLQRWMGLATVSVQTASGSSSPEMSIEGIPEADALRDFLYTRMRGVREHHATDSAGGEDARAAPGEEALQLLREIRDALQRGPSPGGQP